MTEPRLPQQTKQWLTAISTELRDAVQQEVDSLRTSMDQRLAALEGVVPHRDELFDRIAQGVSDLAAEEVKAAAAQARQKAEAAAQSELSDARAQAQTDIEALRTELDATRTAFEAQLAEAEAAQAGARSAFAEAQREITAVRRERDEQAVSLNEARKRIHALEEDHAQLALVQQVAEAHLEEEVQRRTTIAKQLDAAREETLLAKAEADSSRLEAHLAVERVRALENRQMQSEAAAQPSPASEPDSESYAALEHVKKGLEALSNTPKPEEMLTILVEHLSQNFFAVAVFLAGPQGLRLWKSRSGDSAADIRAQIVALTSESPLARALRDRATVSVDATADDGALGLCDRPLGHAIALPVLSNGNVIAVAYAENPPDRSKRRAIVGDTIAEILVDRVNQRLKRTPPAADHQPSAQHTNVAGAELPQYAMTRQARRVRISAAVGSPRRWGRERTSRSLDARRTDCVPDHAATQPSCTHGAAQR